MIRIRFPKISLEVRNGRSVNVRGGLGGEGLGITILHAKNAEGKTTLIDCTLMSNICRKLMENILSASEIRCSDHSARHFVLVTETCHPVRTAFLREERSNYIKIKARIV